MSHLQGFSHSNALKQVINDQPECPWGYSRPRMHGNAMTSTTFNFLLLPYLPNWNAAHENLMRIEAADHSPPECPL